MSTLSTMREHLKSDLILRGSSKDAQIDNAIRSALRQYQRKRYWFLKKTSNISLLVSNSSVALPSDLAAPEGFEISAGGVWKRDGSGFDYFTFDRLRDEYWKTDPLPTGEPAACAVLSETLYVSHLADTGYTIRCTYYRKDVTLPTQDSDTSVWFDDGYDAIRSLAMFIYKREAEHYSATEEDGRLADTYRRQLDEQHENYIGGRHA